MGWVLQLQPWAGIVQQSPFSPLHCGVPKPFLASGVEGPGSMSSLEPQMPGAAWGGITTAGSLYDLSKPKAIASKWHGSDLGFGNTPEYRHGMPDC